MCLTKKQKRFIDAIERNTKGLTAVSTGICPGCEQCRDECGVEIRCECQDKPENEGEPDPDCDECHGLGTREPTMEEFHEQWNSGQVESKPYFSWSGCDLCDSTLGGNFEPWHGVDKDNKIVHGEHACVDCVLYLANGDLP